MPSPEKFKESLIKFGVDENIISQINEGYEDIVTKTPKKYLCACPNYNGLKRDYSVLQNYCYCCAGHFKYHYEIMLDVKLRTVEIVSSALGSDGAEPCVIKFEVV